ncbi:MAG: PhzF family phenazine biosynthesis protein [Anaerolineae bacterium]|nr:PhzF family phenazine biosynthesis protein [Gemmatimonadaceae bacterium]
MRLLFHTADIFTSRIFGGNPLAVFPDARGLDDARMLSIAREFNLSETVFVLPPESEANTRRLRIFTPAAELPFAGHPTVGAAYVLAAIGEIALTGESTQIIFEEGAGLVPVTIRAQNGKPVFAQLTAPKAPEIGPPPPSRVALAQILSLEVADLMGGTMAPQAVSVGLPILFVPLRDRDAVVRTQVRLDLWAATLKQYWAPQIMVLAKDPVLPTSNFHARVFVPGLSIPEDPATGAAAAALGGYLGAREPAAQGTFTYVVEQGFEMGRESFLHIEVDKSHGSVSAIRVGGHAVLVSHGEFVMNGD